MDKIFVNDTVELVLNTGKDVSTYTTYLIKYEDPDNINSRWVSAICPASNLCLRSTVQFNKSGLWKVQAYVSKIGERFHGIRCDVKVYPQLALTTTLPPTTAAPTTLPPTTAP